MTKTFVDEWIAGAKPIYEQRTVTADETEKNCIRELCSFCRTGEMPRFAATEYADGKTSGWWYHHEDPHNFCEATALYEMRRKR